MPEAENPDGYFFPAAPNPQAKRFDQMDYSEKQDARAKFSFLCSTLDNALGSAKMFPHKSWPWGRVEMPDSTLIQLAALLMDMLASPGDAVFSVGLDLMGHGTHNDWDDQVTLEAAKMASLATSAWMLKYVSRYLNEHALMIASFFRVNAKRLDNGEPALLNIAKFVQMCKNDIADGPNPPPEPPAPEPPAEMEPAYDGEPYSPFSPGKMERQQREAKERRLLAEVRKRSDARDLLMEGVDYPETYASASDAY
jgi:hypothetical protein